MRTLISFIGADVFSIYGVGGGTVLSLGFCLVWIETAGADEDYYYQLGSWAEGNNYSTPVDSFDMSKLEETLGNNSKVRIIPYGLDVTEQWEIFNTLTQVFQELETGEEIYLDVTHAFRSLPIFSMTSLFYLQDVLQQSIQIKGVYYGMLETSREFENKAPIIDLSLVLKIQEWIKGAHSFLNYGKGYLLADLLEDKKQAKVLNQFSDALSLNYLTEIERQMKQFKGLADQIESPIAKMILPPLLLDFTKRLLKSKTQSLFQLELSIWHREKKNYFSAFLVFTESLVTYVCEQEGWKWSKLINRTYAKSKMSVYGLQEIYKYTYKVRNNLAHNQQKQVNSIDENILLLTDSQNKFLQIIIQK